LKHQTAIPQKGVDTLQQAPTHSSPSQPWSTAALHYLLTGLIGAAFGLTTTYSFWWPLQPVLLAALVTRLHLSSPRSAALHGLTFGLGWFACSLWWLFISMHVYGGMPSPIAAAGVIAFSLYLGLYCALSAFIYLIIARHSLQYQAIVLPLLFASAWSLGEWLRGVVFTGFPWNATGYGHIDAPLAGLAAWAGVDAVNFAAAAIAALLALAWRQWASGTQRRSAVACLIAAAAVLAVGALAGRVQWAAPAGELKVALIQGNIPQEEKFATNKLADALQMHMNMVAQAQGELIVTPETAIPVLPRQLPPALLDDLRKHVTGKGAVLLVGIPLENEPGRYTNSALGMTAGSASDYQYHKHHLVPFGEFIPFGFRWFVNLMAIPLGDFDRGAINQPAFAVKGQRVAPTICYEDVFGSELRHRFANEATAPTMFANLTNLAWFGNTFAIDQHLAIARMRSLEFARPSIRSTNTGATVVIDHRGQITHAQPRFTRGTLNATVTGTTGLTPYARWGSSWLIVLSALLLILGIALPRLRSA
jgi:apolipoprotein N-acyltransferase